MQRVFSAHKHGFKYWDSSKFCIAIGGTVPRIKGSFWGVFWSLADIALTLVGKFPISTLLGVFGY